MAKWEVRRPDFSQGLVHLTKTRIKQEPFDWFAKERKPQSPPEITDSFTVLREILDSGQIYGSGNAGFIKGNRKAVCLSEVPLSSMHLFAGEQGRYSSYGISLPKAAAFAAGGRPVIYLPDDEGLWIPDDQRWRHVKYEHGNVDFTYEREWRIPGDLDLSKLPDFYVLVESDDEADALRELPSVSKLPIRGIFAMQHLRLVL